MASTMFEQWALRQRAAHPRAIQIDVDPEMYGSLMVLWTPEDEIGLSDTEHLWYRGRETASWQTLAFVQEPGYAMTRYYHPTPLSNGNLGWLKACWHTSEFGRREGDLYLVEQQRLSSDFTLLTEAILPDSGVFSWNSAQTTAVYVDDPYEFGTLYWVSRHALQPIPIRLQEGEKVWFLPDTLEARRTHQRDHPYPVGNVNSPLWLPEDRGVLFWATLEPLGKPFAFTTERYWTLYRMDPHSLELTPLLAHIKAPWYTKLSPDGRHIVYYSPEPAERGLWLYTLERNSRHLVEGGYFGNFAWSPDGQALLAIAYKEEPRYKSLQLWMYEVRHIIAV